MRARRCDQAGDGAEFLQQRLGAGHVDLEEADPKDYRRVVIGFLMGELQRTPS